MLRVRRRNPVTVGRMAGPSLAESPIAGRLHRDTSLRSPAIRDGPMTLFLSPEGACNPAERTQKSASSILRNEPNSRRLASE